MREEMNDRALSRYLGLDHVEFQQLRGRLSPDTLERYRSLDVVALTLEQYATKYNRPPAPTEESDAQLEAAQVAAFARLEQNMQHGHGHRQERGDRPQRPLVAIRDDRK